MGSAVGCDSGPPEGRGTERERRRGLELEDGLLYNMDLGRSRSVLRPSARPHAHCMLVKHVESARARHASLATVAAFTTGKIERLAMSCVPLLPGRPSTYIPTHNVPTLCRYPMALRAIRVCKSDKDDCAPKLCYKLD